MACCDKCGNFDDEHTDGEPAIKALPEYQPDLYYYWQYPLEEDYQMPNGYECLCESCFGTFLDTGEIIEKYDDLTGEPNPKWNPDTMGWFIPDTVEVSK